MYSVNCPECNQCFSRRDAMLRHKHYKHDGKINNDAYPQISDAYPPPPPPPPQKVPPSELNARQPPPPPPPPPQCTHMTVLQHPFTMMISGPTACGKTTFVKELLQNHNQRILPQLQRIVIMYRRWQPLYSLIKKTVIPSVEFIQGVPNDLEEDDFFDARVNNLLVLDDLFSEAGKDKRITDLFTEGSHHRSLSVISINQNLFGTKDPTQRRNCHYLVLFNNPVDRQSVMTLARQMYPGHTDIFMKSFQKATKHPYGYLLVDFKPFTKEEDRLKYDIQWAKPESTNHVQESGQKTIKEINPKQKDHYSVGVQTDHIKDKLEIEDEMAEKGQACDDCGLLFDSGHDVQRHVKRGWCPENSSEPPAKTAKMDTDDGEQENVEENEGYLHLWGVAQRQSEDKYNKFYDQYIDDGENKEEASELATERTYPYKERIFFETYQSLLELYWLPLMNNSTHRSIVEQIDKVRSKGISLTTAVKRVLKKSKQNFEELFETEDSDEEESEDEESDDEAK